MYPLRELLGWSGYVVFCVAVLVLLYKSAQQNENTYIRIKELLEKWVEK